MRNTIKNFVKFYIDIFRLILRLNLHKTIYINFKTQSLKNAIKFPIFIYGDLKIISLNGKININTIIKPGVLKIGYKYIDLFPVSLIPTQIKIDGTLTIHGNLIIGGGVHLNIERSYSRLTFGSHCTVGGGTFIKSTEEITCGDNVQITSECVIMDCEMHYVKNIETGIIKKNFGKIFIGNNCWINQRSVIVKNVIIPDYCIIGRNSFLNKDYSKFGKNLLLVGQPAVPSNYKVQRIFNIEMEKYFNNLFRNDFYLTDVCDNSSLLADNNDCSIFKWNV